MISRSVKGIGAEVTVASPDADVHPFVITRGSKLIRERARFPAVKHDRNDST